MIYYDNEKSRDIINISREKVLSYGFNDKADVRAEEIKFKFDYQNTVFSGVNFKLRYRGSVVPVFINGSVGYHLIYASLVAAIIGREFDMNLLEISEALRDFKSPRGRLNLIEGINHSIILDDTYNSSPQSAGKALEILKEMEGDKEKKIVIFGDMLELGDLTVEEHVKLGALVAKSKIDLLLCIGDFAENICSGALKAKMSKDKIISFNSQKDLFKYVKNNIHKGDIVLVKGSQGARMEKVVKALLKNKEESKNLLVRQEEEWMM